MTLVITHSTVTGAAADTTALVDGPKWDANHTLTGVVSVSQGGTGIANNNASTITITGSFGITFTVTADTSLTLPTSGTLAVVANPNVTIGLTAVNGSAVTAMRSDGAPALSQAITPTWTGAHVFSQTAGTPITINVTNSGRGFSTAQTYTGSLSTQNYNLINVTSDVAAAGATFNNALGVNLTFGGSAMTGGRCGIQALLTQSAAANSGSTNRNYVGLTSAITSAVGDGGGAGTEKGAYYGGNIYANLSSGATRTSVLSALELNTIAQTGSSVLTKTILNLAYGTSSQTDAVAGTVLDTMINMTAYSGGGNTGISFNSAAGTFPVKTNGTLISVDSAGTITNGIILTNATITGTAYSSTGFSVSGAGNITSALLAGGSAAGSTLTLESTSGAGTTDAVIFKTASQSERARITTGGLFNIGPAVTPDSLLTVNANTAASVAPASGTNVHVVGADATPNIITADSYGSFAELVTRRANGTQASKTALTAGGNMFICDAEGWNGSAYVTGATIQFVSAETWSGTASGTYFSFQTTPLTTTGRVEAMRVQPSGGISIGLTSIATDPGIGSIQADRKILSSGAASGIGYSTGAGGAVTQATSKSTATPTINNMCGAVTMNGAALAAATIVSFVLTNSSIAATDVLVLNHISGGTVGAYTLNAQAAAGSATINVRNNTAGSLSEAIVIQFAVIKAVNS